MNFKTVFAFMLCVTLFGCGSSGQSTSTSTDTGTVVVTPPVTPPPPPTSGLTPTQKAQIISTIEGIGGDVVDLGLTQWSKSNNQLATTVAQALKTNIEDSILPILNGQSVKPSTVIADLVASNLYTNIPPLVKLGLEGGSVLLDHFFSIPGASDSDKVDFIRAFVTAIDNGANAYLATPPAIGKSMRHPTRDASSLSLLEK